MLNNKTINKNNKVAIVAGISTSCCGRASLIEEMDLTYPAHANQRPKLLFDVNGHAIALYYADSHYRTAVMDADIVHADGQSVVLASKLLCENPVAERSATTDLIFDVAERAEQADLSFFLLGGEEAVNIACAAKLRVLYPKLRIVGQQHGFFKESEEEQIVQRINEAKTDILWVGLGKPREQLLSTRLQSRVHCRWIITCGGCFNFVTGEYVRAPLWMQKAGLEWLFRLSTNPSKLLWRYLTTNPIAVYRILKESR